VAEPVSDEILMAAYQAGNRAAFDELFARHAGSVYGFLARRLPDRALAEDLYQEAFLRVHRARGTYDPARPFRAWLFGIVHNLLIDTLRDAGRTPRTLPLDESRTTEHGDDRGLQIASSGGSPEEIASTREAARALDHALHALPQDEATVLLLARMEGMPYEDIAQVVGRTPAATKQLAYRALQRVRAGMTAAGHGDET
jgi:RNA polymerase sigma-70 factor (ECF subfamily)